MAVLTGLYAPRKQRKQAEREKQFRLFLRTALPLSPASQSRNSLRRLPVLLKQHSTQPETSLAASASAFTAVVSLLAFLVRFDKQNYNQPSGRVVSIPRNVVESLRPLADPLLPSRQRFNQFRLARSRPLINSTSNTPSLTFREPASAPRNSHSLPNTR
jgi:hypothetical protein